ncbi:MlaD family protein [Paraconexibacter sp.]|uniref:MlaD family protein n=1 Tax=Paraconexibacter sp. TaxID=2949640 RepID=UPI00356961B9
MTRRRPDTARLHVLLGIVGLVVIAAVVWISYGALRGLPLEQRYRITAIVPSAQRLHVTDEVRIAGTRVGQVDRIEPRPGEPASILLHLKLDADVEPLPADTRIAVRPASVLGATYVDLVPGVATATIGPGQQLPASAARRTVAITDLFDLFDRQASKDLAVAMSGFGDGLAGRGPAMGVSIHAAAELLDPLRRVMRTLAAPSTGLAPFLEASARFSGALASVREPLASMTTGGATTFAALASDPAALGAAIDETAPTARAVERSLRRTTPLLGRTARLASQLRQGAQLAPGALRALNDTLRAGRPALRAVPETATRMTASMHALRRLSSLGTTRPAIAVFGDLITAVDQFTSVLAPAQVHCNVIALTGQGYSSFIGTVGVGEGPALWNLGVATTGAEGEAFQASAPAPDLKVNYMPNSNAQECESGNEPPNPGKAIGNPPGLQPRTTRITQPPPGTREKAAAAGLLTEAAR